MGYTVTLMNTLAAQELIKEFGVKRVVDRTSLNVHGGEVVGLLGPNGAGKTTTFYMLVGIYEPDAGQVIFNGDVITDLPMYMRARRGITYLPQETSIFRKLSVEDNIMAVLETMPISSAERTARLNAHLQELNITHIAKRKAFLLSGGERRRVEITRALATSPKFILFDEPFTGIDPIAVQDIQNIILGLKSKGIGILISDHNVRETLGICDRAYIVSGGRILVEGHPETIIASAKARSIYLGENFTM
jgi:lipopolysaccharide export system ATP-binding protein